MQKTTVWPLCSIFNNGGHVFRRIKNPHICSMQDTLNTFTPTLVPIGQVASEFWTIVNDNDGRQLILKAHLAFGQVSYKYVFVYQ